MNLQLLDDVHESITLPIAKDEPFVEHGSRQPGDEDREEYENGVYPRVR